MNLSTFSASAIEQSSTSCADRIPGFGRGLAASRLKPGTPVYIAIGLLYYSTDTATALATVPGPLGGYVQLSVNALRNNVLVFWGSDASDSCVQVKIKLRQKWIVMLRYYWIVGYAAIQSSAMML